MDLFSLLLLVNRNTDVQMETLAKRMPMKHEVWRSNSS